MSPVGVERPWVRRGTAVVFLVAALSPVFSRAASIVEYTEPLENAAEATGAVDHATAIHAGIMPGYGVPGVPDLLGILIAGVAGTALVLVLGILMGRFFTDGAEN